jgi:hypothetical protein
MSTFRVAPRDRFVRVRHHAARDPRTSLKAKGLHGLLLSFDDNWVIYKEQLQRFARDGRTAIDNGIDELVAVGYLIDHGQRRQSRGRFSNVDYEVFETPYGQTPPPVREGLLPEDEFVTVVADNRFVMVRNAAMRDPALSFKAKGLLLVMFTFPPGTYFSQRSLTRYATDGIDGVRTAMGQLKEAGYVHHVMQARRPDGSFANSVYLVADYRIGTQEGEVVEARSADAAPAVVGKRATVAPRSRSAVVGKRATAQKASETQERAPSEAAVVGFPAVGERAAKKNYYKKSLRSRGDSSSTRSARGETAAAEATTSRGERTGLLPQVARRLAGLLADLITEDPRRATAWPALDASSQRAAYGRAQDHKTSRCENRAFVTLLKEELDRAAGLARVPRGETLAGGVANAAKDEGSAGETSAPEGEVTREPSRGSGLDPQVRTALGDRFVAELYREDARREQAWGNLSLDAQREAIRAARAAMNEPGNTRAFRTVLRAKLDEAAGLANTATRGDEPRSIDPVQAARARNEALERAARESEAAFDAALEAGLSAEEADRRAAVAYQAALARHRGHGGYSESERSAGVVSGLEERRSGDKGHRYEEDGEVTGNGFEALVAGAAGAMTRNRAPARPGSLLRRESLVREDATRESAGQSPEVLPGGAAADGPGEDQASGPLVGGLTTGAAPGARNRRGVTQEAVRRRDVSYPARRRPRTEGGRVRERHRARLESDTTQGTAQGVMAAERDRQAVRRPARRQGRVRRARR